MKRSSPLWGSVSVLIGVVIAILALVRGAWLLYGMGAVGGHVPASARVGFYPRIPEERARRQKAAGSIALQYGADQCRRHAAFAAARQPSDLCVSQVGLSERPLGVDNREPNCARYAGRHRAYPRVWY